MKVLLPQQLLQITLRRLAHQLLEDEGEESLAIIGIQPRGVSLSDRLFHYLREVAPSRRIDYGRLDITFYRDDLRHGVMHLPSQTDILFSVEGKRVILVDDVLHTGRTVRAAMDALVDFGRPSKVELLVLIDRRFSREVPIQPDYTGKAVDTVISQRVRVFWQEKDGRDEVVLMEADDN